MTLTAKQIPLKWTEALSIYASEAYLRFVSDEFGWLGGFDSTDNLRCVLPYTYIKKAKIRMVRFRIETFTVGGELSIEDEKSFLESAMKYFQSVGTVIVIPASNNTVFRTYPGNSEAAPYGSYVIDLQQSEAYLWSKIHSKHRNVVRNAKKKGVVIKTGIDYKDVAYDMVKETLERSSMKFMNRESYAEFTASLGENVEYFAAVHEGAVQGAAIIPYSNYAAYYLYGGSTPRPLTGAMNLLHWHAINLFRERGTLRYDFVGTRINPEKGSKQEGISKFKQRFGGELRQGFMWRHKISPLRSYIYKLGVKWIQGGDIVDAEGHKLVSQ